MKNDSSFFISRYIGWLKSTEVWQRMVVRAAKRRGSFLMYAIVVTGVLIWTQVLIEENRPILKLEELDKRTGILVDVGVTGRPINRDWFNLLLPDGQVVNYGCSIFERVKLKQLVGQSLTVWSEDVLIVSRFGYEKRALQIQHQNDLIMDYEGQYRPHQERIRRESKNIFYVLLLRVLPTLLIVLPLLALWHVCREPKVPE